MQMLNKGEKLKANVLLKANFLKDSFHLTDYQDFKYSIIQQI